MINMHRDELISAPKIKTIFPRFHLESSTDPNKQLFNVKSVFKSTNN